MRHEAWTLGEPPGHLTESQLVVLRAYLQHQTYGDAASALGMSYGTVRNHLYDARQRVGVDCTLKLAILAWLRYWID